MRWPSYEGQRGGNNGKQVRNIGREMSRHLSVIITRNWKECPRRFMINSPSAPPPIKLLKSIRQQSARSSSNLTMSISLYNRRGKAIKAWRVELLNPSKQSSLNSTLFGISRRWIGKSKSTTIKKPSWGRWIVRDRWLSCAETRISRWSFVIDLKMSSRCRLLFIE